MKVSIVIPNWNGSKRLKRNLPKVLEAAQKGSVKEVIVVDDASVDDSARVLKENFSDINLIQKDKNSGFSTTVNLGVEKAGGDLVLLLNNDVSPKEDFLEALLPHFKNPKVFSVGCNSGGLWVVAYFKDGYFWHSQASVKEEDVIETHRTLWASGGSGIFKKSIWQELSGLDELFNPFYEEDADLGYRATKRGYLNLWEPKSVVEHYREPGVISTHFSKQFVDKIAQRNQLFFIWKNITSDKLISEHVKALAKRLLQHPKYWQVFLSALIKRPQILAKREVEKKQSKLSDEEVFRIFAPTSV